MRTYLRGKISLLFITCAVVLAIPAIALADQVANNLDNTVDSSLETMNLTAGGASGSAKIYVKAANTYVTDPTTGTTAPDGKNGCNLTGGSNLAVSASSSNAGVATVSPSSATITGCDDPKLENDFAINNGATLTVTPVAQGSTTITVSGPGSITVNGETRNFDYLANFTVNVAAAPVTNHAPTVSFAAQDASGNEGFELTTSGAFSDEDDDPLTITQVSGAGTVDTDNGDGTWSWSHTPNDQGSGTVVVRASDGTATVTDTFDWSAANVAPTATFNSPDVDEGTDIALSLTGAADASSADTTAGFEYAFDCGDGNGYSNFSSTSTASCPTTDNGTRSVGAKIRDKDGGVSTYTDSVTVANVAPELSALSLSGNTGTACLSGNTANLSFSFSDVGSDDTHNGTIAWGDGSTTPFTSSPQNNVQHTYGAGTYTITVTVNDDDGDSDSDTGSVSKLYKMSGILSPFNTDGSSTWKYGATIPVKVQITDCAGTPVSGLAPKLGTSLANAATPAVSINEDVFSTSNADTGNVLRYSDPQYIYNFNSKSAAITDQNATYWMSVKGFNAAGQVVTDPAQVNQKFGIKSK